MSKIIVKLKEKFNDKNGFVWPLFSFNSNKYEIIGEDDYPNNGKIFVASGIEQFDLEALYFLDKNKLIESNLYEEQLRQYNENETRLNPSKFVLHFLKAGVKRLLPIDLIKIYPNSFSFKTHRLLNDEGMDSYSTDPFFLESDNEIYGPFKRNYLELSPYSFKSNWDEFPEENEYMDFLDSYSEVDGDVIFKINKEKVNPFIIRDSENNSYLTEFKSIFDNGIGEQHIFLDDSSLIDWGKEKILKSNPEMQKLLKAINNDEITRKSEKDKLKWQIFTDLISNSILEDEVKNITEILNRKGFLNLENEIYLKEENEKLSSKNDEILRLNDEISRLKGLIDILKLEIDNVDNSSNKIDSEKYPRVSRLLVDLEKGEDSLQKMEDNEKLSIRKELLEEDINKLEKRKAEIQISVKDIIKSFEKSASEHTTKLAEAKLYTDLLNGIEVNITPLLQNDKIEINPVFCNATMSSAKDYVSEIRERFKNLNRDLSFNDVANLIVTVNQSFLTILAGAPGVGKTSLVEKFAKSLGLSDEFGYLEIPCSKGWNSSKDLIGFHNPLTNKFQPSKTKLLEALSSSSNFKNSPFIVLLDEANLSPMEHYWSDFIKVADFDYSRTIKISEKETIEFGNGFRFIATINHDHTTELLSNRLLDRVSVIQIEKPNNFQDRKLENVIKDIEIFDINSVNQLFGEPTRKWTIEGSTLNKKFQEITKSLESNYSGFIISPRKLNAVTNYMKVATGLLEGNDYIALDYALVQLVFPLINIRGDRHFETLQTLRDSINSIGMKKSSEMLSKIIERGKEFKHFKYIYY